MPNKETPIKVKQRLVPELLAALISAREQLKAYELEASGEMYNDPELNALIASASEGVDFAALLSDARYVVTDSQAKFVRFKLSGEVPIDAHRTATIDREISIRVRQKGNLPRHRAKVVSGKKGFQKEGGEK